MRKIIFGSISVLITSVVSTMPARASLVQDASLSTACQGDVPVVVHSGMGAVIDFTQTDQVVERAWLGDPSKVTLDFDRPLEGGSRVLFLRRISELSFDGLPATSTTLLTAVLAGAEGSTVCQFPVSYSSSAPEYTNLRLNNEPEASTGERTEPRTDLLTSTVSIDDVERGIEANALVLGQDSPVVQRVNDFIGKVRGGEPQQSVAQELEIEWALILELSRQGARATATTPEAVSIQDIIYQQPSL